MVANFWGQKSKLRYYANYGSNVSNVTLHRQITKVVIRQNLTENVQKTLI